MRICSARITHFDQGPQSRQEKVPKPSSIAMGAENSTSNGFASLAVHVGRLTPAGGAFASASFEKHQKRTAWPCLSAGQATSQESPAARDSHPFVS